MKLHLGCGPHIKPGWQNLDLEPGFGGIRFDLTRPLPHGDNSADVIFSEHFIEHLTREQAVRFLKECYRVLKPGGTLRLTTPDLLVLVMDYCRQKTDRWKDVWQPKNACQMLNGGMRLWGHQHLFDGNDLELALLEAGFKEHMIINEKWGESAVHSLRGIEVRPFHEEIIVEATK